jgi:DNA-binding NarL/FixJ family response regulator
MIDDRSATDRRISVLVVDDHDIVRAGVTSLLERSPRIRVVGGEACGKRALAAAKRLRPRVVVMDLMLPALNGIDATKRILAELPATRVVILTACSGSEHIVRALRAGALGYVSKQSAAEDINLAVFAVLDDRRFLSPLVAATLARVDFDATSRSPLDSLSAREREVLHLTGAGCSNRMIAQQLSLSQKTVATYSSRIIAKLGVANRTAMIHFCIEYALAPV